MVSQYLPLTEYSSKYKLSISTLRRRIKADEIKFIFADGKYLILDQAPGDQQKVHRPSPRSEKTELIVGPKLEPQINEVERTIGLADYNFQEEEDENKEVVLQAANRLLSDLKKAYTQILQEKEEQIMGLKAEIADLKTLVRALEAENAREKRIRL